MMYSEFVEGTGCRDNEHNYKVFKDLEIMYVNSDMSKAQIYEYGKKLVDNSKSQKELELEANIKEQIEAAKRMIEIIKKDIEWEQTKLEWDWTPAEIKDIKRHIKAHKERIKEQKIRINSLKWVLEA